MKRCLSLVLVLCLLSAQAQTTPPMSTASVVLSVIRIALNLGSGRQDYVQVDVEADGATVEQARHLAFRTAIEQSIGTVVASQSQSQQQRMVRDEIITYSSGYVDKFEILKQYPTDTGIKLRIRVWVAESRLAHRLLGRSMDNQSIPGDQLSAQISTLIQERLAGDQLIATIMQDFPERSFIVEAKESKAKFNEYRQAILEIPVVLKWDRRWTDSLFEALNRTQDPAKGWIVYNAANRANPMLKITLTDAHGVELIKQCEGWVLTRSQVSYSYPSKFMLDIQRDHLILDYRHQLYGTIRVNLGQDTSLMQRITQIRASVVPANKC